ncbi:MAG: hypothetical protein Kow0077_04860 [Anaerolineae bacterium]
MPSPSVAFAFIIATMLGAAFHLIVGGDIRRLALFLLCAWLGFALGQVLGVLLDVRLLQVGVLRLLPAGTGAFVLMMGANILTARARP